MNFVRIYNSQNKFLVIVISRRKILVRRQNIVNAANGFKFNGTRNRARVGLNFVVLVKVTAHGNPAAVLLFFVFQRNFSALNIRARS